MDGNRNSRRPPPCAKGSGAGEGGAAAATGGDGRWGHWVMGTPVQQQQSQHQDAPWANVDHASSFPGGGASGGPNNSFGYSHPAHRAPSSSSDNPYVQVSPIPAGLAGASGGAPSCPRAGSVNSTGFNPSCPSASGASSSTNPYVQVSPLPAAKSTADSIWKAVGRCGKTLAVTTEKATGVAGNVWHHLKTSPKLTDAALASLSQGAKVFAEGGRDKVFHQNFGVLLGEQLLKAYACYISTSSGPVIGTLYLSTARVTFCGDNPLPQNPSTGHQDAVYYKVVLRLDQLGAVSPSANSKNPAEKYIQILTRDGHEFWFMGFVSYEKALMNLKEALQHGNVC